MSVTMCEEIGAELVAFLDGELADDERRPVAAHVSTCLTCRREMERLGATQRLIATLPRVEPSATFAADFWRRLEADADAPASNVRRLRPFRWAVPALAAAAALVLVLQQSLTPPTTAPPATEPAERIAAAPAPAARKAEPAKVAAEPKAATEAQQLADVEGLRPEDLPPALLEHPELFLRLPVVRRLDKLEYLGSEDGRQGSDDGAG